MKNIILCSDGTGNRDVEGRGTNVFKLFEAIDLNEHRTNLAYDAQLAFYDDGVGTRGNPMARIAGGAVGYGLERNVKELYRELVRVYDPGDRIFLFGFSRGAFTVRTLAGMIDRCGVLKNEFTTGRNLRDAVDEVYAAYRAHYHSRLTDRLARLFDWPDSETALNRLRSEHSLHDEVPIEFIGVWDTVDAVGLPFAFAEAINSLIYQFKFPACRLGRHVKKACQALSIDDPRLAFSPVLWKGPDKRVEQVWFAGVHSNVGGGYPKQGMSLVALDWMLTHAEALGLRLQHADRELFRGHATVDDLMYNPRAGWGALYRWGLRDIKRYCEENGVRPAIHLSVAERIAHGTDDYAPGNIPPGVSVAFTPIDAGADDCDQNMRLLTDQARIMEQALHQALGCRYLLAEASAAIRQADASYALSMIACLLLGIGFSLVAAGGLFTESWTLMPGWLTVSAGLAGLGVAALLARASDRSLDDTFSGFWQRHQEGLRAALKHCKTEARREAALFRSHRRAREMVRKAS
jgi:T6SS, Phospholipase effector Tle1-like, catalytic domain